MKQLFRLEEYVEIIQACVQVRAGASYTYSNTTDFAAYEESWQAKELCEKLQLKAAKAAAKAAANILLTAPLNFTVGEVNTVVKWLYPLLPDNSIAKYCRQNSCYNSES